MPLAPNLFAAILFMKSYGWEMLMQQIGTFGFYYFGGLLITFGIPFLYFAVTKPASFFEEQKEKAQLYTTSGIELTSFAPTLGDIRPCGIMVTNRKAGAVRLRVLMTKMWQDRTEIANGSLPKELRWYVDGNLQPNYELIEPEKSLLIALEHVQTERERGAILLHASSHSSSQEDFGRSIGLEFGGELSVAVFEKKPLRVEIEFNFIINGLHLNAKRQFLLSYGSGKLVAEKIEGWISQ